VQVLLGQYCYGQKYREDTLFNKFRKDIQIEQEEYGRVVWDEETRETYYLLIPTYSVEALVKYTDDSIPAVRAEIFAGLAQKNADEKLLREISNKHLNDTAKFTLSPTDVVITWSVRDYMQSILRDTPAKPEIDFKVRLEKITRARYMVIAGAHHGIIIKDFLLQADSLICPQDGMKIISFVLTVRRKTFRSRNILSGRTKRKIKKLRSGERIFIENIKAEGSDKTVRQMGAITLKIK
jgi:hypothetical protein